MADDAQTQAQPPADDGAQPPAANSNASIGDLQHLGIWTYLGQQLQTTISDRFAGLDPAARTNLVTSLQALDQNREEIISQSNETTFRYILQQALIGLADELADEVKELKHAYFKEREKVEQEEDEQNAEAMLDQL